MNDERLEQALREWLADEGQQAAPAADLRQRVAGLRDARPVPRSWLPWTGQRARPLLVGVATVALAAVVGLALAFSGALPVGRPDCSRVTIQGVRDAVREVPGYAWRMTGSELLARLVAPRATPPLEPFEYRTAELEFAGAYDGPDAWRIDVLQGYDHDMVIPPSIGLIVSDEFDAWLFVDGHPWARANEGEHYQPAPGGNDIGPDGQSGSFHARREANQLYGLLHGEPFRFTSPGHEPIAHDLSFAIASAADGCHLNAVDNAYAEVPGASFTLEVVIDPETLLPGRVAYGYASEAFQSGDSLSQRQEVAVTFTYDYADPPTITSPVPPGFEPVDDRQAVADARQLGIGSAPSVVAHQLGAAQAFALYEGGTTAILLYDEGRLVSAETVPDSVGVHVALLRTRGVDPAVFLVAVVNDPRVESVEAFFEQGASRILSGAGTTPQSLSSGEGLGDLLTWTARDQSGDEVPVDPPPP